MTAGPASHGRRNLMLNGPGGHDGIGAQRGLLKARERPPPRS